MKALCKEIVLLVILLSMFTFLSADMNIEVTVEQPLIKNSKFESNYLIRKEGEPQIQYIPVRILIPFAEKITSVNVQLSESELLSDNTYIDYSRPQIPISSTTHPVIREKDEIYSSASAYPSVDYAITGIQRFKGYDILFMKVYPYKYFPAESRLCYSSHISIDVNTEIDNNLKEERNLKLINSESSIKEVSELVNNPQEIKTYAKYSSMKNSRYPDPSQPYSMIIITDQTRQPYFNEFVNWKNNQGISTGVFLTSQIYSEYTGIDNQEKIRNFIIDAYETYAQTDTPLEYVFLGGDDEIIPIRGCYGEVGSYTDTFIPCDMYYGALDGNWNSNGNNVYGEENDNPDLTPEVAVGRIPAETEQEFARFFHKTFYYTDVQSYSNNIAYMYGEALDNETLGSLSKDNIIPYIPEDFVINTLYERDGTYNAPNVRNSINSGLAIINHLGHANQTFVFNVTNPIADIFTNTEYGFAFSQGCYPAAFDEGTSQVGESIAEHLVFAEGGLYAFVGNTRYGWYSPGTTEGASQFFDLTFFDALFTQNIRQLGKALNRSKIMLIDEILQDTVMRWCAYELILFGDPSVSVKDAVPGFPMVTVSDIEYNDEQGDGDGSINPGETISIFFTLENDANWYAAENVTATIDFLDESIDTPALVIDFGAIAPGESVQNETPYNVDLPIDLADDVVEYEITVHAEGNTGAVFEKTYKFNFVISLLQTNWPWYNEFNIKASPIICDYNHDNVTDLIVTDIYGNINNLDYLAVQQGDYPIQNTENIWKSIAMADMNNDNLEDFVFASLEGRIFCQDEEGNDIFSYDCDPQLLTPVIADVNGDGYLDVISMGQDKKILVVDNQGNILDYFPVEMDNFSLAEIASADINNDNNSEIIVGTQDGLLSVFNHLGQNINGFPVDLQTPINGIIILDNKNIVASTTNKVYQISPQGQIVFSKTLPALPVPPIAADFNEDGLLEIAFVLVNGSVYVIDQEGNNLQGFPVSIGTQVTQPPLAADLNGNGVLDVIVFSTMNDIFAYEADGAIISITPICVNFSNSAPATIGDIDADGDLELVSGLNNGIIIIDSKYQAPANNPWSMYRGNRRRTGYYNDSQYVNSEDNSVETPVVKLYQNFPNPFSLKETKRNAATTISFDIPKDEKVTVDIFNLKGQKVNNLLNNELLKKGNHLIPWNGKDSSGKDISSGIYMYRLKTDTGSATKKMIMIK